MPKKSPLSQDKKQNTISFKPNKEGERGGLATNSCSPEKIREAIATTIIVDDLPFNFVENDG